MTKKGLVQTISVTKHVEHIKHLLWMRIRQDATEEPDAYIRA